MNVRYKINGKPVSRRAFNRKRPKVPGVPIVGNASAWPIRSIGLGVPRSQVQEFNDAYEKAGIKGVRHLPSGDLEISCNSARNAVLKLRGLKDNDAGYGQYAGK